MAIEEHGGGRQLVRFRSWPRWSAVGKILTLLGVVLGSAAMFDRAWGAAAAIGVLTTVLILNMWQQSSTATVTIMLGIEHFRGRDTW